MVDVTPLSIGKAFRHLTTHSTNSITINFGYNLYEN